MTDKWIQLLDVYADIEEDIRWRGLRNTGARLVRGDSSTSAETASIMIIPQSPGAVENGQGRMLVGQAGSVLGNLLEIIGLAREDTFITPLLKYRLPGNRPPVFAEEVLGLTAMYQEISIIRPSLIIAMGPAPHRCFQSKNVQPLIRFPRGEIRPITTQSLGQVVRVASMHNPGVGLTEKSMQDTIEADWVRLGSEIREKMPELLS